MAGITCKICNKKIDSIKDLYIARLTPEELIYGPSSKLFVLIPKVPMHILCYDAKLTSAEYQAMKKLRKEVQDYTAYSAADARVNMLSNNPVGIFNSWTLFLVITTIALALLVTKIGIIFTNIYNIAIFFIILIFFIYLLYVKLYISIKFESQIKK